MKKAGIEEWGGKESGLRALGLWLKIEEDREVKIEEEEKLKKVEILSGESVMKREGVEGLKAELPIAEGSQTHG
jgi:hypothetical protein